MNPKKKKFPVVLIIILAAILLIFLGVSYVIGDQIVTASTNLVTNEQTMELYKGSWEHEGFDEKAFKETYFIEEKHIPSSLNDHDVPYDFLTADGNENIVIMAHGMMGNRLTNYPTAQIFLNHGYNVVSYDQRSSGKNTAQGSTYGYLEKYDLMDCVKHARKLYPDAKIVVWGESFGGATALLAMEAPEIQKEVSALILDCPMTRMDTMVEDALTQMKIPLPMDYLLGCGNFVLKQKMDFSYEDVNAEKAAESIQIPTLIFNSKTDEITPYSMGVNLYKHLGSSEKELYSAEDSVHIEIRLDEPEFYEEKIVKFLP